MAKLMGKLPDENGLNTAGEILFADPTKVIPIVGLVTAGYVKHNYETGADEMYVKLRQVELIDDSDLPTAERLIRRGAAKRTGKEMLPIELEDELSQIFAGYVPEPEADPEPEPDAGDDGGSKTDGDDPNQGPDFSDGDDRG